MRNLVTFALLLLTLGACQNNPQVEEAAEAVTETRERMAADVPRNPLKNAYFGETHLHTAYSLGAYIGGVRKTLTALPKEKKW